MPVPPHETPEKTSRPLPGKSTYESPGKPIRKPRKPPSYRLHKSSNRAICTIPNPHGGGRGRDVLLGRYGSPESRERYARLIAEWNLRGDIARPATADITVIELIDRFRLHVEATMPRDKIERFSKALAPARGLYGLKPARSFGPLALKIVRQAYVDKGWCRRHVNEQTCRLKRLFAWGVEEELLPGDVHHALQAVRGLRIGTPKVRESEPVKPVALADVLAIKDHCSPVVWAMVQLQMHTGARAGEICAMRTGDLDTSGKVWLLKLHTHKTAHHGHERVIPLGPQAQAVLAPFIKTDLQAFIFTPADSERMRRAADAAQRRRKNQLPTPRATSRTYGDRYTTAAYRRAIAYACGHAGIDPAWSPHRLRHSFATRIRREHGLEAARVLLGHRTPAVTEWYADIDQAKAIDIAARCG